VAVWVLVAACAPSTPTSAPGPRLANPDAEARVTAALEAAVVGDPHGPVTDTLYAPGATVISNGNNRLSTPRLAGVMPGGQAAVTSSQVNVRQDVAWAVVDYRWFSDDKAQVRLGKATLVLAPLRNGVWKVVQMHSSSSR
jgi:hypothetical protein